MTTSFRELFDHPSYFDIDKTFSRKKFTNISPKGYNSDILPWLFPVLQKDIPCTVFCYPQYTITGI